MLYFSWRLHIIFIMQSAQMFEIMWTNVFSLLDYT